MSDTSFRTLRLVAGAAALWHSVLVVARQRTSIRRQSCHVVGSHQLTPENLRQRYFNVERPAPTRWLEDGSGYTTLEESESANGRDIVRVIRNE